MQWQQNQQQTDKKVNPDDFVDLALRNAATYKFQIAQRIGVNEQVNMDNFKQFYVMLVNDAESACVGCRFVVRAKRKFVEEELTPIEVELMDALRKYFSATLKPDDPMRALNIEKNARSFLREAIEGFYDSKINQRKAEIMADNSIPLKDKDFVLANYRYQLLLESVTSRKVTRMDVNM